jgi:hypothetical protein
MSEVCKRISREDQGLGKLDSCGCSAFALRGNGLHAEMGRGEDLSFLLVPSITYVHLLSLHIPWHTSLLRGCQAIDLPIQPP